MKVRLVYAVAVLVIGMPAAVIRGAELVQKITEPYLLVNNNGVRAARHIEPGKGIVVSWLGSMLRRKQLTSEIKGDAGGINVVVKQGGHVLGGVLFLKENEKLSFIARIKDRFVVADLLEHLRVTGSNFDPNKCTFGFDQETGEITFNLPYKK